MPLRTVPRRRSIALAGRATTHALGKATQQILSDRRWTNLLHSRRNTNNNLQPKAQVRYSDHDTLVKTIQTDAHIDRKVAVNVEEQDPDICRPQASAHKDVIADLRLCVARVLSSCTTSPVAEEVLRVGADNACQCRRRYWPTAPPAGRQADDILRCHYPCRWHYRRSVRCHGRRRNHCHIPG